MAGKRQIIDSQVHIWLDESADRPWPKSGVATHVHLDQALTYQDLLGRMQEAGVDRAILVPPSWEGDRNDYAQAAARAHPDKFAVMGRLTVDDPASRQLIAGWRDTPGMLGIRLTFVWEREKNWLHDGTADWIWPEAERAGVPLYIMAPQALPEVDKIAERHPGLRLIINHMGVSNKIARSGGIAANLDQLVPMARLPNVHVKLSGLPGYSADPYPFQDLHDHIHRVVDAFGPQRCFWGTDLSRLLKKCSYREAVTFFTEELKFLSATDLDWIMGRGLAECLRWNIES